MSATTTKTSDIRAALNSGNDNITAQALKKIKAGNSLSVVKAVFTGLTAAAAIDVTTAASKAGAVLTGITLDSGENLPPIGQVVSLRVTAGAAAAGARVVTDAGGVAGAPGANGPGIALLSDDGKTLTFEGNVTAFVLTYRPRPDVALSTELTIGEP